MPLHSTIDRPFFCRAFVADIVLLGDLLDINGNLKKNIFASMKR
jgi:hypothetical protein